MQALALALLLAGAEDRVVPREPSPGTVTLPLIDYDRLVERAAHPARRVEAAPVAAVVARADARLRVVDGAVRGTIGLEGEVFREGSALVPLLGGGVLLEARAGLRALPLVAGSPAPQAVVPGPGPFALTLEWATDVVTEPGRASFVLPATGARSTRVVVEVPGENADVRVEPGIVARRTAAGGRTVVEAALDRSSATRFSWSARETAPAARREAVLLADVKTLVSLGEADVQIAALLDVTVVQGEPERFDLTIPDGFEVAGASGRTLESTASTRPGVLGLITAEPSRRRQQFLVTLERSGAAAGAVKVPLASVLNALRESGEVAVVGAGTLDVAAAEAAPLKRIDPSETGPALKALARGPVLAAFRYLRRAAEPLALDLKVQRFPDAAVLAALAPGAVATTLVTQEGRRLTEVALTVENQARPFLKVDLPAGATILSAEVAGQSVKPVSGADGLRVPLLRAGFRPEGPYLVSFVYLESGTSFVKKGEAEVGLPRLDLPVSVLRWELFLPERYRVKRIEGDALGAERWGRPVPADSELGAHDLTLVSDGVAGGAVAGLETRGGRLSALFALGAGHVAGMVADESGAPVPGATLTLERPGFAKSATTGGDGTFVLAGVGAGRYTLRAELSGFRTTRHNVTVDGGQPRLVAVTLKVAGVAEEITVTAEAPALALSSSQVTTFSAEDLVAGRKELAPGADAALQAPSSNVLNLQRRVAGVLPVRIDVPRAGTAYHLVRPLVVDEETRVRFRYRAR